MLEEIKKVLAGIRKDTEKVIRRLTENHFRCERYDVTTAPNGTVIGVTQPFGTEELLIPYSWMCSNAQVGDTVIVVWWNGLSNAQAWFMGDGWVSRLLSITSGGGGITVNGTLTANSLELSSPLPIASGGTGATEAYQAVANLQALGLGQARAQIPTNADLNNYYTPGVYGVASSNIAITLDNRPSDYPGTLRVWNGLGNANTPATQWSIFIQEYIDAFGHSWTRRGIASTPNVLTWTAWTGKQNVNSFGNYQSYTELPDGTLIQWGVYTVSGSGNMTASPLSGLYRSGFVTISFPVAFYNSAYSVSGSSRYSTGNILPIGATPSTAGSFLADAYDFYARPLSDGNLRIYWQAVGRWK